MLHFQNKQQYTHFAQNLNKWVDQAINEHNQSKQEKPYISISGTVEPVYSLAVYNPELKQTNSVWETVLTGFQATLIFNYSDGVPSYQSQEFKTLKQAKNWLKTQYTTIN